MLIAKQKEFTLTSHTILQQFLLLFVITSFYVSGAKAKDLQIPYSVLHNSSDIIRANLEAQAALKRERTSHLQLKLLVKHRKTVTDGLQRQMESLQTEKTNLKINRTTLEESCGRCLPGWILLESSCYFFSHPVSHSKKNWADSRAYCISQGGDLLVINNSEEQQRMSDNFPKVSSSSMWWQNGLWIGLTDVAMEGTWVWVNNVTEFKTMYWRPGQPNRSGPQSGNCAAFYFYSGSRGTWYNGNCHDHQLRWICEMEPN
ncbi:C-type lectin domain family 4 member M-like isoform X2 [Xiphias gladius]|uniref:C-type lectin domain family 4 member M-like isoform X2 n=1 Tax=Xiphias gladius TaxID=8245 RepID=UPI001A99FC06|nr:C-type lectin domain family 4 member M-like isoform X2 [Xiphias gladius]